MTSVHVPGHGVMLDLAVCKPYWELMLRHLARAGQDGGRAAGPLREAQHALRAAVAEHLDQQAMSAVGSAARTSADMGPESETGGFVSTARMAERLSVGVRHARRLASIAGIEPAARDAWHSTDIDRLEALRRTG